MDTGTFPLTAVPCGGRLGAIVHGADLRRPLTTGLRHAIEALLYEHLVLFFPEQHLDDEQQLAFAGQFGGPYTHPLGRGAGRAVRCEHIVDDVEHPPYQDKWHTDVSWDDSPPTYGTLRAIDLPSRGGDTIWASMYAAYDALSPVMQAAIEPLRATHTMGSATSFVSKAGAELVARVREQFPGAEHPVVGIHPTTGRRYLNVNAEFTASIVGMTDAESRALLSFLTAHAAHPNLQLRHSWHVGEVAIWDERCTQHFAVADYLPERREMGRVAVRIEA
ncbi:MAG TPA: TauD/TfdA family dioxygenase [Acidimicrobiales bacterium]|nr:TauD/TfdA family dioxygenase [Acidimicrobiales bacterium]